MCGIIGISFQNGCTMTNHTLTRYMLRELLHEAELRGYDASGVAYVNKDEIVVFKAPMASSDLIATREFNIYNRKYMNLDAAGGTISAIGHCRAKTKGTPMNNDNNHPIVTDNLVGVHNGEIENDDALFARFMELDTRFYRHARVDSEIIFRLIDYFTNAQSTSVAGAIRQMSRLVEGSYVCAMAERKNPYLLWLFRKLGPLVVNHYQDRGVIIYASGKYIIDNAIQGMGLEDELGKPDTINISRHSGLCINLFSNTIRRFKLDSDAIVDENSNSKYPL